mmetsp:Transcript_12898/g.14771  ORF Transcript_12898/g.14771 Transcript_12898/m.14771 type:complete len:150 (-) Transcript_12898:135-584(-)
MNSWSLSYLELLKINPAEDLFRLTDRPKRRNISSVRLPSMKMNKPMNDIVTERVKKNKRWELIQEIEYKKFERKFEAEHVDQSCAIEMGNEIVHESKIQSEPQFLIKTQRFLSSGNKSMVKRRFAVNTIQKHNDRQYRQDYSAALKIHK